MRGAFDLQEQGSCGKGLRESEGSAEPAPAGRFIGAKPGRQAFRAVHRPYLFVLHHKENAGKQPKDYTLQEVLDDLDIIECFEVPGQKLQVGEIAKHQMALFSKLGTTPPASLQ